MKYRPTRVPLPIPAADHALREPPGTLLGLRVGHAAVEGDDEVAVAPLLHRAVQRHRDRGHVAEFGNFDGTHGSLLVNEGGEMVERAAAVVVGAGGDGDEVGGADVGEAAQLPR